MAVDTWQENDAILTQGLDQDHIATTALYNTDATSDGRIDIANSSVDKAPLFFKLARQAHLEAHKKTEAQSRDARVAAPAPPDAAGLSICRRNSVPVETSAIPLMSPPTN